MADAAETRAALEFVCQRLRTNVPRLSGLPLDAETLRRAKHDDSQVARPMWDLLIRLLDVASTGEEREELLRPAAVYCLSALGYPRSDQLLASEGSREVLLAVAYLVDAMDLLSHRGKIPQAYPQDISSEDKACQSNQGDACNPCHQDVLLQLYSKWRNEMRRLQQLDVHRLNLLHNLQSLGSQRLASENKAVKAVAPPTQYELYILERPALFLEHIQDLEHDIEAKSSHRKEELFWRWMGSVLKAADDKGMEKDGNRSSGIREKSERVPQSGSRKVLSHGVIQSMEKFQTSWDALEARKGQPLHGTARWGDLRQHWEMHKMLPPELQQILRAELRNLGRSFDETLPSPWNAESQRSFPMESVDSLWDSESLSLEKSLSLERGFGEVESRSKQRLQQNVAELRTRFAKTSEHHAELRSAATTKLAEATSALAALGVFVNKRCEEMRKLLMFSTV